MKGVVLNQEPKVLKKIQFSLLNAQDTVKISEFEVTHRDLYTTTDRLPVKDGVLDQRLGTSNKNAFCETCGQNAVNCVGHYAYIKLIVPVFHIGYFKHTIAVLQAICKTCAKVLLEESDRRLFIKRFRRPNLENIHRQTLSKAVNALARKAVYCPSCSAVNGTVKKAGALRIVHDKFRAKKTAEEMERWKATFQNAIASQKELGLYLTKAVQEDLNPLKVLDLFRRIPDEDCELIGMQPRWGRPEEFIWQYLSVPPVCIRPSVAQDGASNEDDITVKLTEIVFTNALIKQGLAKGSPTPQFMEQWEFLQLSVAMYINSELSSVPSQPGQKPIRGFVQRLKGKQGRFRGNLSGKRVDFSGRTVISPDPNLQIDEVAIPERVAKILTYPERVIPYNIERLRLAVRNGPDSHPGANYVARGDNKKFLRFGNRNAIADNLSIGDIVERHIVNGDVVLFNRQPSLHKLSIMCHRAKVRPWRSFRLNECVCGPYNADFDGDEMNLHVPQTEEARTEALELMNVKNNLVTPRNGEPVIAAIQDFITASFLLSQKDTFLDRRQFTQICSYFADANMQIDIPPPTIWKPASLWTGKQIFNVLMRPSKESEILVNVESKCHKWEEAKPENYSEKMRLANDLSPNDGWLVIVNSEIMCGVMDKATIGSGKKKSIFGVILRDYGPHEAALAMNRLAKLSARYLANYGFSLGIGDVIPGPELTKKKDQLVAQAYTECQDIIALAKKGNLENKPGCNQEQTLEAMISSVLSKVREAVGQICMKELSRHNAPLIMATCGSKGSVINVSQMVACVGQQIISGHRVPDGFQDRSLPHFPKKSKEPPSKGFVWNSFFSGLVATEFLFHAISGREGLVDTAVKTAETGYMQRRLMKALEDLTVQYDLSVRNSEGGVIQFTYGDDGLDPSCLEGDAQPIDLDRAWNHIRAIGSHDGQPLLPYEILELGDHELSANHFASSCSKPYRDAVRNFLTTHLACRLAELRKSHGLLDSLRRRPELVANVNVPSGVTDQERDFIDKTKVTKRQIQKFLDLCRNKYVKARIEPGSTVGAIGAQSIGEPGTQMTLKTFHFAGVASMNVTLGVPRIKEIINGAKTISTPIISCKLVTSHSEASARIVKGRLEKTLLGDIASILEESWAADYTYLGIIVDMETIQKLQLELTLDDIKWAIVNTKRLKIKQEAITILPRKYRLRIYLDGPNSYYRLRELARGLPGVVVKGVPTISRAIINIKDKSDDRGNKGDKELLVEGYGLQQCMITEGSVVGQQTTSNHVIETAQVLGIEAARRTIINEIQYTMKSHDMIIDPRHVMLLGDVMTYKGEVLGITRFGVAKMKDSVLMLASFEKTTDHLFDAAAFGKIDKIAGVSESIIMGNPATLCGTSMPALYCKAPLISKPRKLLFENITQ